MTLYVLLFLEYKLAGLIMAGTVRRCSGRTGQCKHSLPGRRACLARQLAALQLETRRPAIKARSKKIFCICLDKFTPPPKTPACATCSYRGYCLTQSTASQRTQGNLRDIVSLFIFYPVPTRGSKHIWTETSSMTDCT